MSPKDDSRIRIITWVIGVGMPLLFAVLIAYLPLINNNSKAATEALTEIKNVKELQKLEFDNIEKKIKENNLHTKEEISALKSDISIGKQNFRIITDKLRDQGLLKNVEIIDRQAIINEGS